MNERQRQGISSLRDKGKRGRRGDRRGGISEEGDEVSMEMGDPDKYSDSNNCSNVLDICNVC